MGRLDDSIVDMTHILNALMTYRDIIQTGNCNSCRMKIRGSCTYLPKPGQLVRYNCPFYKGLKQEGEG